MCVIRTLKVMHCFFFYHAVTCRILYNPLYGVITCSLGDDGVPSYGDTCIFTCNTGYVLSASYTRTCQIDGSWSGSEAACREGWESVNAFNDMIMISNAKSMLKL